jgi:phosphoglycerate kinase
LGVFELPHFAHGTYAIATALIQSKAKVIIGGGDLVAAIQQMGLGASFSHLSTGGGASLEFLEFGHLPGIDALNNANSPHTHIA